MVDNIWRLSDSESIETYESCMGMNLGNGILISKDIPSPVLYSDNIHFQNFCYRDNPIYMATKYVGIPASYLPIAEQDWKQYISVKCSVGGNFTSGIYPLLVAYAANFVLTLFLTILAFIIIRPKPYLLVSTILKIGCLICTINIIITLNRVFKLLRDQHAHLSVTISSQIIDSLSHNVSIISLHFISLIMLQLCQVFIVMRTFERNKEKRIILFGGVILTIVTCVLWVTPHCASIIYHGQLNWDIFPVFVYLFRIAIETLYTCFIISFALRQSRFWLKNLQMIFLTLLTILSVLLLPGFFIADISNLWISQLGEVFDDACYISSTFLPWEWLKRLSNLQKAERAQSILGRPIYDNEQQNFAFAKYALRTQRVQQEPYDNYDDDDDDRIDHMTHESISFTGCSNTDTRSVNRRRASEDNTSELHYSNTLSPSFGGLSNRPIAGNSCYVMDDITADHESIDEINFNPKEKKSDLLKAKFSSAYNKFVLFTDHVILKNLGSESLSSTSNSDKANTSNKKKYQLIKRHIGLDKPPATYVYNTTDVVFDSDGSDGSDSSEDSNDFNNSHINSNNQGIENDPNDYDTNNTCDDHYSDRQPQQENLYYDQDFERDFGKHYY
ncbi:hypothetical protein RI543_005115 [Arxiozyma heterogenica]|uniref:pH-response regulator protein palH/RIM21 n=1 Tax=Arxiozyma heterogenica TaxID=278026 RepID=A0AAN7WJX6_9SACH|nr:hypothetical protein RI543_005115 [Kazachstania heterogenica]